MIKRGLVMSVVALVATAVCPPTYSLAQGEKRSKIDPRQELLDRLHSEPTVREVPGNIRLLPGYKHKGATDFEGNATGEIWKKGGLKISYAMGFSWGQEADPRDRDKYLQYWDRTINKRNVRFAFTKEMLFIASVPLDDNPDTFYAANFRTRVQRPEDATEMVTMALSLIQQR